MRHSFVRAGIAALALGVALTASPARAHEDPAGCFQTGPAIIVSVFRADGVTGVVGNVSECEPINYQATLQKASNSDTICAFSGGTFSLKTPDGVVHTIDTNVPCIGGNSGLEGCVDTVTNEVSPLIPYTVSTSDVVAGLIVATATYTGGEAHDTPLNTQGVSAITPKSTPVVFCNDNNLCTTDICDPTKRGLLACSNPPVVCDDNNACTTDTCDQATGLCSFSAPKVCDDGNACTTDSCNTTTGDCEFSAPKVCDDGNACTTDTCNPSTGACEFSAPKTCDDNNACTTDTCNTSTGACEFSAPKTCDDNNACTTDTCNTSTGACEFSAPKTCDDGNACTTDSCNTSTGDCEFSAPKTCDDGNACTTDTCNTSTGACEFSAPKTCDDGNACTTDTCNTSTGACEFSAPKTCDDNNACTTDTCNTSTGACEFSAPKSCNDESVCTTDTCNPATGQCVFTPVTCSDTTCQTCDPVQGCIAIQPPPAACVAGCRVTGGGIVDACGPVPAGCDPSTGACAPNCDFAALDATHGGQVGAPIGAPTAFSPDSVCIQGEWTHVRHIRPGLFGNFHASTFDSLMCACLPCADDPGSGGVIGALCNPGDRICGPEPRRAPDNKICFSGVGKYAESKGKRTDRAVIFRTDVEDHSEPGGGTAHNPPDRYRHRMWFIGSTGNHGDLGNPDDTTSAAYALRQQVGCADPTTEQFTVTVPGADPVPTPDIDDGGDLLKGNQQIHPSLNKTCN